MCVLVCVCLCVCLCGGMEEKGACKDVRVWVYVVVGACVDVIIIFICFGRGRVVVVLEIPHRSAGLVMSVCRFAHANLTFTF
jgi:hypothetical protein